MNRATDSQITVEIIVQIIIAGCARQMDEHVCSGAIRDMAKIVVFNMRHSIFNPNYFCARSIGVCSSPVYRTLKPEDYVNRVLADKPEIIKNNDFHDKLYDQIHADPKPRKTVKVLHLSDPHLDFEYFEGTNAECGKPVCCRVEDGLPSKPEHAAGKYGHKNCDAPSIVAESAFEFLTTLSDDEKPDLILWTGDNTPHDVWEQSVEQNAFYTVKVTEFLEKHLPNIPVISALGNHEFFPVNVMKIHETDPTISSLANVWAPYLDPEAVELFSKYGYYSQKVRLDNPAWKDVKVISINSEQCNNMNWYLWSTL